MPAEILWIPPPARQIRYYSDHPSYNALPQWLRATVNARGPQRTVPPGVDRSRARGAAHATGADRRARAVRARRRTAESSRRRKSTRRARIGVPLAALMLMFMTVMSSAPQLLNSVIEEKMSRISEVLIGSITPFELMMGKLIGSVAVSVLLRRHLHRRRLAGRAVLGRLRQRDDARRSLGWFSALSRHVRSSSSDRSSSPSAPRATI